MKINLFESYEEEIEGVSSYKSLERINQNFK